MNKQHHVVPSPEGGWEVKEANSSSGSRHFRTKEEAVDYARKVSREKKTELVIHDEKGRIVQSDSHGNDPYPPRG